MADRWYFGRDGEKQGPFSAAELKAFAAAGRLRPQDTVWKEGVEKGSPAVRVRHLFAEARAELPAPDQVPVVPEPAAASAPTAQDVPDDVPLMPLDGAPAPTEPLPEPNRKRPEPHPPAPVRKLRVLGVKGGVIVSQNDGVLRYRKKCDVCGEMDPGVANTPIRSGVTRVSHFCRKCRKSRQIEIQVV